MISVIIPVYNTEEYLTECLESLVAQSSQTFEALIIDDGSTDGSANICRKYSNLYSNFHYYRKENGGLSDARNFGMRMAKGDYLLFLDSDDYLYNDSIAHFQNLLTTVYSGLDILVGDVKTSDGTIIFNERQLVTIPIKGTEYYKYQLQNDSFRAAAWLQLVRREFVENHQLTFTKGIFHEDEEFTVNAYLEAETIADTAFRHYFYRRFRDGSIMSAPKNIDKRVADMKGIYQRLNKTVSMVNDNELSDFFNQYWLLRFFDYLNKYTITKTITTFHHLPIDRKFIAQIKIGKRMNKKVALRKKLYELSPTLYYVYMKQKSG